MVVPGEPHHVTQRGVRWMETFFEEAGPISSCRPILRDGRATPPGPRAPCGAEPGEGGLGGAGGGMALVERGVAMRSLARPWLEVPSGEVRLGQLENGENNKLSPFSPFSLWRVHVHARPISPRITMGTIDRNLLGSAGANRF